MPIARVMSSARASNIQRYGGTSHDAPTISPSRTVSNTMGAPPGGAISSATRPCRIRKNSSALSPSRTRYWPASNRWLRAQPVTIRRWSGAKPAKNGCSPRMRSRVSMPPPLCRRDVRSDRGRFFGDVDAHRAPCDAAAAADAARGAELVDPVGELVRHPLPVARLRALADAAAVDEREVHGEATVPDPDPLGRGAGQVAMVLDGGAEAGRADHRAVRAGQAALGDLIPALVVEVRLQQLLQPVGLQRAPHLGLRPRHRGSGGADVGVRRGALRQGVQQLGAGLAAGLDQELVPAVVDQFGQREVKARLRLGPRLHRDAEARAARLAAVDGDEEGVAATACVGFVVEWALAEHAVLDGDGIELAGAHAEEGVAG